MNLKCLHLLALAGLLVSASCAQFGEDHKTAQRKAEARWSNVRGKIKLQLATESFTHGDLDEAQKQLTEALALDQTMPEAYLLHTRILLERGEIASAQEALKNAVTRGAQDPETDYLAGVIAQRYGRLEEALVAYRRAAERNPQDAHFVAAIAETLVALDRPQEALTLIESRWTDFEHNATLRATAGQIYMLMGRYEQAADVYREAVRISPTDETLQCQLGVALSLADKGTEAVTVLAPLAAKDKDLPGYALVALGRAYLGSGKPAEAKSALRRATDTSPNSLSAWTWLARASLIGNDLVTAREAAAKATECANGAAEPYILLGYVCLRQGHNAAAIRALQTALDKQPNDALATYLMTQARRANTDALKIKGIKGEASAPIVHHTTTAPPTVQPAPPAVTPANTGDEADPEEIVRRANNALRSSKRKGATTP